MGEVEGGGGEEGVVLWTGTGAVIMYAKGSALAGAALIIAAGFLVAVGVIAHGRMQLSSSNSRVVLAGKPDQWYADYLMQPARDYTMPDGEGFSNTYPFVDPPNGGPLNVLHQVKRGRSGKLGEGSNAYAATTARLINSSETVVHRRWV